MGGLLLRRVGSLINSFLKEYDRELMDHDGLFEDFGPIQHSIGVQEFMSQNLNARPQQSTKCWKRLARGNFMDPVRSGMIHGKRKGD